MNDTYRKPLILAESELAEGVYTASGSGSISHNVSEGSLSWSDGNNCGINYTVSIDATNAGTNWSVTLSVTGGSATRCSVYDERVTGTLTGGTLTITPNGTDSNRYNVEMSFVVYIEGTVGVTLS